MGLIIAGLAGFAGGMLACFLFLEFKRIQLDEARREIELHRATANEFVEHERQELELERAQIKAAHERTRNKMLEVNKHLNDIASRETQINLQIESKWADLQKAQNQYVAFQELVSENEMLKTDLRNSETNFRKLELDEMRRNVTQLEQDKQIKEVGSRYLKDTCKWISSGLTSTNFTANKQKLLDVIDRCLKAGLEIREDEQSSLIQNLKAEYEMVVRAQIEREHQARIKAKMREEAALQREIDRELKQLEREREAIKVALEKALEQARDQHSEEVERLKTRLADAEAKAERAISRAQQTRSGNVYVISNIGSFGEGVFKIGMTRREDPLHRIRELSNASVPFPYDVHVTFWSEDAPSLETALHRALHKHRLNKANPRKEFFRTDVDTVLRIAKDNNINVDILHVADATALQYRQSQNMSDEDADFISEVFDEFDESDGLDLDEI